MLFLYIFFDRKAINGAPIPPKEHIKSINGSLRASRQPRAEGVGGVSPLTPPTTEARIWWRTGARRLEGTRTGARWGNVVGSP